MTSASTDEFIPRGPLKHLFGLDLLRDIESLIAKRARDELGIGAWLRSLLRCRHFYYASWRDPLPGMARFVELLQKSLRYATNILHGPRLK